MSSYNRCVLMGNLTRDPELRYTPSNQPVAKFGIATNKKWTNKQSGEVTEKVCFIDCTIWGPRAVAFTEHLQKGASVLIEGELALETWDAKNGGGKRSKHVVNVSNFEFVGGKREREPASPGMRRPDEVADGDPGDVF